MVTDKSAPMPGAEFTTVDTGPTLLLLPLGSEVVLLTPALLLRVPAAVGVTTIVTVAEPGYAMVPIGQVTVPAACEQLP